MGMYWLLPAKWRNPWILLGSLVFYAWGAPKFVFVLLASITIDFVVAKRLHGQRAKLWLWTGLVANVGLLVYFKYANFFVENTNVVLTALGMNAMHWTAIALPIGISFFTFQKISYLLDVYGDVKAPAKKWTNYAMYVVLFPQLIAGPIVRYRDVADAISNRRETWHHRFIGLLRFSVGLAKKVIIANSLGAYADPLLADPNVVGVGAALALLAYTFQIFFDFSGYSDMALGLGLMMGFKFPENFNLPYRSGSITEFWRRWHITLGVWMRDYLYIPLGGNRKGNYRLYLNLIVVFFISGLWHGAQWTFVLWGVYHGIWLMLERLYLGNLLKKLPRAISVLWTFILVAIGWAYFRLDTVPEATNFLARIFTQGPVTAPNYLIFALAALCAFGIKTSLWPKIMEATYKPIHVVGWSLTVLVLLLASASTLIQSAYNPFIYFRF